MSEHKRLVHLDACGAVRVDRDLTAGAKQVAAEPEEWMDALGCALELAQGSSAAMVARVPGPTPPTPEEEEEWAWKIAVAQARALGPASESAPSTPHRRRVARGTAPPVSAEETEEWEWKLAVARARAAD